MLEPSAEETRVIAVRLRRIIITENSDAQVVWLKEHEGERAFPIVIGLFEAAAIDRSVKEIRAPRPLTHDLLANVIAAMGGDLLRVEVVDIRDNTFFARIVIAQAGEEIEVDARPSDAIALAVEFDRPILVAEKVLEEVKTIP